MALVDDLRSITSTENDDYHTDAFLGKLLDYAKKDLVNLGISFEKNNKRSLRFLDQLRTTQALTLSGHTTGETYFKVSVSPPADFYQYIFLKLNDNSLIELDDYRQLNHGNAVPSDTEGYFIFVDGNFDLFLDEKYTSADLIYIQDFSTLDNTSTSLEDLDDSAEQVVLYRAAVLQAKSDPALSKDDFETDYKLQLNNLLNAT